MSDIELKNLVGKHMLSGVDLGSMSIKSEYGEDLEDCATISFTLDKKTYCAIEDPNDGYRSMMREIKITNKRLKNNFKPIQVFGIHKTQSEYGRHASDIIQFYDIETAKIVLEIGTDRGDGYYPSFVNSWHPENLAVNKV